MANCGWMLRDSAMVTMDSLQETTGTVADSFPKNEYPECTNHDKLYDMLTPGKYDRRDVTFCQITLALV